MRPDCELANDANASRSCASAARIQTSASRRPLWRRSRRLPDRSTKPRIDKRGCDSSQPYSHSAKSIDAKVFEIAARQAAEVGWWGKRYPLARLALASMLINFSKKKVDSAALSEPWIAWHTSWGMLFGSGTDQTGSASGVFVTFVKENHQFMKIWTDRKRIDQDQLLCRIPFPDRLLTRLAGFLVSRYTEWIQKRLT